MNETDIVGHLEFKRRKNRVRAILIIIVILHMISRSMIVVMPSALMPVIMSDMGLVYFEAGMMAYIVTIMMGVFLFVGSSVISRLGAVRTLVLAMALFGLDGILSFFSRDYLLVLLGRALSGIGYGFSVGVSSPLIAAWFDKKQHSIANSISSVIHSVSFTVAYGVIAPVYSYIGSWQGEMILWSGFSLLCCLALLIWSRGKIDKTVMAPDTDRRPANSLLYAIKYKEIWYLTVAMAGIMWVSNCFMTYLPTYLVQSYELPIEQASSATGIMSLAGIIGSLFVGFLYRIVKKKKMLLCVPIAVALASSVCIPLLAPGPWLYICIFCFGFNQMGWGTTSSTLLMDFEGVTPAILSGLMAIMIGTGSLLAFFAPFIFNALREAVGMQTAMLSFTFILVFSLSSMLLFPSKKYMHSQRVDTAKRKMAEFYPTDKV